MHSFEGKTADEVWRQAASMFGDGKNWRLQPGRGGPTRELSGAALTIKDPRQRWVVSRQPAINPAFALAEVLWIMNGRRDSQFLNYWNPKLPQFAGSGSTYHGAYGFRLRHQFGIDQLERAYQVFKENPETRQVVLQIWSPSLDMPLRDGTPAAEDVPCNLCSILKIRDGKLEWTQVLRSNDLFLGVPHNFVQFTTLQEIVAGWLGVPVGAYRHFADCLHVYEHDLPNLRATHPKTLMTNTDQLLSVKEESDKLFLLIAQRMDEMIRPCVSAATLCSLAKTPDLPQPLSNWTKVIAADCARRHGWNSLAEDLMAQCSNPVLSSLWAAWLERTMRTPKPTMSPV